jgi:hypothetical protein
MLKPTGFSVNLKQRQSSMLLKKTTFYGRMVFFESAFVNLPPNRRPQTPLSPKPTRHWLESRYFVKLIWRR